jgi:restriction endonuclease Mrr
MLTAKDQETDKVKGLELGADDYLTKPFGVKELLARIKARLRRAGTYSNAGEVDILQLGEVKLDLAESEAIHPGDKIIELTAREVELIRYLLSHANNPVSRDELLEKVKSIDPFYFEKVILILLKKMGYGDFIETAKSGDGGIDGIINEDKLGLEKIYTQAKRYNESKVREKDIRNFIGAMSGDTRKGVFITTSTFDTGAVQKAREAHHSIILIDGARLVDLMFQYNVGVQIKTVHEVKELDHDFFEGE